MKVFVSPLTPHRTTLRENKEKTTISKTPST